MMSRTATSKLRWIGPGALAALLCCTSGIAQNIEQFPIAGGPWSIALGSDGAMWFTQDSYHAIGRIDSSGTITQFQVTHGWGDIAFGSDGNVWLSSAVGGPPYGEIVEAWIDRLTPSGVLTEFPVSDAGQITAGPDGNLWFTEVSHPRIGRITTAGSVTEFALPTGPRAVGITAGPDGNVWFTRPASRGSKIGRITPGGTVTEFDVPADGGPYGIAAGPDGNIWFTDIYASRIGRITPTGAITEFPMTSMGAYAIVAGADGNLWAAGTYTLSRITPSGSVTDFPIPTSGDNQYHMNWLNPSAMAAAPDGSIWIADSPTAQIVRFSLSASSSCVADPTTLCLDNGRFRVRADWKAGDGSTGHGRGVNLTANSGYFWFFDAANIEMVVKVLDGCSANQHHWAFAAGLTNVEVTTTVTDTYSGLVKTYTNPQGTPFAPIQDTTAFATCQ